MSQAALVNGSRGRIINDTDRRFIRVLIGAHRRLLGASSGRPAGHRPPRQADRTLPGPDPAGPGTLPMVAEAG